MWLNGISGAGKTVLSSCIVEHMKVHDQNDIPGASTAYFYFDFSDRGKQTTQGCMQSLVKQLFDQSYQVSDEIRALYSQNKGGTPSLES
jgi:hypothetical protein